MPSLTKKVSDQLKAKYDSVKTKAIAGTSSDAIKNRLEVLKQKAKTNIAHERASASKRAKTALPESHRFVSRNMAQLSKQAARNRPMTLNPNPMSDIENMIFHSEQMQSPYINNIESITIGDSRNATDGTLTAIEKETLGIRTQPQPRQRQQGRTITIHLDRQGRVVKSLPKRKKQRDWQDTINNL
jgi:hypothetical protein